MEPVLISIQDYKDKDQPLWPDIDMSKSLVGQLERCGILERGMSSGKTSLAFVADIGLGRKVIIESSAEILFAIVASVEGALDRWKQGEVHG